MSAKLSLLAVVAVFVARPAAGGVGFYGLGFTGSTVGGAAISADGQVVTGRSPDWQAFSWTAQAGRNDLGFLPGDAYSDGWGVSGDGSVIVGASKSQYSGADWEAFRWTASAGIQPLAFLPGYSVSMAQDVSEDGSVVVGYASYNGGMPFEAFVWTERNGMVALGDFPGGDFSSVANGVSADGSVVVGWGKPTQTGTMACRWKYAGGGWVIETLGELPGGVDMGHANTVSRDGSVIAGESWTDSGVKPFRWSEATGMVDLGVLPGFEVGKASAISGDGAVVGGYSLRGQWPGPIDYAAFIWDSSHGMRELRQVLEDDCGLDLGSWVLERVVDVSANGQTFLGIGINPQGLSESWIAVIPEPATMSLLGICGLALIRRRRA